GGNPLRKHAGLPTVRVNHRQSVLFVLEQDRSSVRRPILRTEKRVRNELSYVPVIEVNDQDWNAQEYVGRGSCAGESPAVRGEHELSVSAGRNALTPTPVGADDVEVGGGARGERNPRPVPRNLYVVGDIFVLRQPCNRSTCRIERVEVGFASARTDKNDLCLCGSARSTARASLVPGDERGEHGQAQQHNRAREPSAKAWRAPVTRSA